ncbi:D-amino-acid transaminase [Halalkalibacter oceani]|uniref:D-amino-acid transaminase n=1 Tax=Halalkalibacter oceani TaxID=1653776 RepID=UPI003399680A
MVQTVLFNNEIVSRKEVKIDLEDRGYQFGDGIYEVIGVYNTKTFKMAEHLKRLERSAKELRITLGNILEGLEANLEKLIALNGINDGIVYVQVSRGVAPRAHQFSQLEALPVVIAYTREMERPIEIQEKGVNCLLTEDIRWLRCDVKTLNLLGSVLAKQKAIDNSCYESILHRENVVTEGTATNVFIIKNQIVYTHPADNFILNGITRSTVIDLCKEEGIKVVEEKFDKQQLLQADEGFLTGTFIDIVPINKIEETVLGKGEPGRITEYLQRKFNRLIN